MHKIIMNGKEVLVIGISDLTNLKKIYGVDKKEDDSSIELSNVYDKRGDWIEEYRKGELTQIASILKARVEVK